jgi:hypothetical protein
MMYIFTRRFDRMMCGINQDAIRVKKSLGEAVDGKHQSVGGRTNISYSGWI